MFQEFGKILPPPPPAAPGAIAWSQDGSLQQLAHTAGLTTVSVADVANPLIYPDLATAVRTQLSSGPARKQPNTPACPPRAAHAPAPSPAAANPTAPTARTTCSRYLIACV